LLVFRFWFLVETKAGTLAFILIVMGLLETLRRTVRKIPRGKVASYGDVARTAGHAGAARQVVWALRSGHGLPWHRVVGAGGRISLPGEHGLEQRIRLEMEGVKFRGSRVAPECCVWQKKPAKKKSVKRKSKA